MKTMIKSTMRRTAMTRNGSRIRTRAFSRLASQKSAKRMVLHMTLHMRTRPACFSSVWGRLTLFPFLSTENSTAFYTRRKAGLLAHIRLNTLRPGDTTDTVDEFGSDQTKYVTSPSSSVSTTPVTTLEGMEIVHTLPSEGASSANTTMEVAPIAMETIVLPLPMPTMSFDLQKQRVLEAEVTELYSRRRLTEPDFEYALDVFEKQAYLLKSTIVIPEETDEDQVCSVCLDGTSDDTNQILFCDGCNIAVHQNCYGVRLIPDGEYKCNRCLDAEKSGKSLTDALTSVICEFCDRPGGAMKRTTNPNEWAHIQCALWLPETELDLQCAGNIRYVCPIPTDRFELRCYICNRRRGAPIQCAEAECVQAFHVTCAQDKRLCLSKSEREEGDELLEEFHAWCGKHTPSDYRYKRAELLAGDKSKSKKEEKAAHKSRKRKSSSFSSSVPSTPMTMTTRSASGTPRSKSERSSYTQCSLSDANGMVTRSKSPYFTRSAPMHHRGDKRRKISEDYAAPVDSAGRGRPKRVPLSAPATPALPLPPTSGEPLEHALPPKPNAKRANRVKPEVIPESSDAHTEIAEEEVTVSAILDPMDVDVDGGKLDVKVEEESILPVPQLIPVADPSFDPPQHHSLAHHGTVSPKKANDAITLAPGTYAALLHFNNDGSKDAEFGNELSEQMAHDTLRYCWGLTLREARRKLTSHPTAGPKTGELLRTYKAPPRLLPGVLFELYKFWFDKRRRRRGAPLLKKFAPSASRREAPRKLTDVSTRELVSTYRQLRMMRTHVERIRLVLEVTRKRERLKRELVRTSVTHYEAENLPEMANMRYLLEFFREADSNGFFALPVSTEIAPTYYDIIKSPMDFRTMEDKLNTFQYYNPDSDPDNADASKNLFIADLRLIMENAMTFNAPETIYHQEALRLDHLLTEVLQGEYRPPTPPPEPMEQDHVSDVLNAAQETFAPILSEGASQMLIDGLLEVEDDSMAVTEPYDLYGDATPSSLPRDATVGFLEMSFASRHASPLKVRPLRRPLDSGDLDDVGDSSLHDEPPVAEDESPLPEFPHSVVSQSNLDNADLVNSFWS